MTAALATLNPAAQVALASCEQRIERGLKTFIDVGQALAEIRDSRLYKGTHDTFEDYCRERWGFSRQRAQQFTAAAELATTIVDTGLPSPTNEGQARALAAVPEPERADVWREATERTGGKPTAKVVTEIARERTTPAATPAPAVAPSTAPAWAGPDLSPGILRVLADGQSRTAGDIAPGLGRPVQIGEVQEALQRLAEEGLVDAAGRSLRGSRMQELWVLADAQTSGLAAAESPAPVAGPDQTPGASSPAPGPAEVKPTLRLVPDEDEKRAAVQRDARGLLRRAVEILAPAHNRADFAATWARQLGPYDEELSGLIRRAAEAITTLDELIEGCGQ